MKHAGTKQARRGKAVAQLVSAPKTPKQLPSLEEFRQRMGRPGTPAAQLLAADRCDKVNFGDEDKFMSIGRKLTKFN